MTSERWHTVEELFHQALEYSPQDRETFLSDPNAVPPDLNAEVRNLLRFHSETAENEESATHKELLRAVVAATELLSDSSLSGTSDSTIQGLNEADATHIDRSSSSPGEILLGAKRTLSPLEERFDLQELVGYGGSGCVLRAWDKSLQRTVAIKVLHADTEVEQADNSSQKRLLEESRNLAGVQSEHIVQVFEVGEINGSSFIVMEYVAGTSLRQFLKDTPELTPRLAAEITKQIASGLADAHSRNLVHRDIKPGNILIAKDEKHGYRIKIVDFGLARASEIPTSASTHVRLEGTPAYMPPEILEGSPLAKPQSDVYAVGVTCYQLLTKVLPFRGALHMLLAQKRQPVTLPRSLDDRIPVDLESVCLKAMSEDPQTRYNDAKALRDDLDRFLTGHATLARPLSKWQASWRWIKRHQALSAAIIFLFLFLGTLSVGSSFYASLLWSKNQEVEYQRQQTQIALESQILTGEPESLPLAVQQFERMAIEPVKQLQALVPQAKSTRSELNVACALAILGKPTQEKIVSLIPIAPRSRAQCQVISQALKEDAPAALVHLKEAFSSIQLEDSASQIDRINFATLAWYLNDDSLLQGLLQDPHSRTEFIHGFANWCPDLDTAIEQCSSTDSPELSTAFLLGLGWIDTRTFSARQLTELKSASQKLDVEKDVAPGLASAARWFLRKKGWQTRTPDTGLPFHMIPITAGSFLMGSGDEALLYEGRTQQRVNITRPFLLADQEISVGFFRDVLSKLEAAGQNEPFEDWSIDEIISPTDSHPVQQVSWFEAIAFCNALSAQFNLEPCYKKLPEIELTSDSEPDTETIRLEHWSCDLEASGFRLPTEAEWEYAARAGTLTSYSFGDDRHFLDFYGSWSNNTRVPCEPCATLMPNQWGLFDMHGNVWEWTQDWYSEYPETERTDPCVETPSIRGRSFRGGGVATFSGDPLSNSRGATLPDSHYFNLGFRVARTITD